MRNLFAALLIILGCTVVASAVPVPAPEIDPSSAIGVVALIGSALIMLKQQRKK